MSEPTQCYGWRIIRTAEEKKAAEPRLSTDEFWNGEQGWNAEFANRLFLAQNIYRRRIEPGIGFEMVPPDEIETDGMDFTRDGVNWHTSHTPSPPRSVGHYTEKRYGVLAFRRKTAQVERNNDGWISVKDSRRPRLGFIFASSGHRVWVDQYYGAFDSRIEFWKPLPIPQAPLPEKTEAELAWEKYTRDFTIYGFTNDKKKCFMGGFEAGRAK